MNTKEIQALLELVDQFDIEEFEMERSGVRIRIRKGSSGSHLQTKATVGPREDASLPPSEEPPEPALDQPEDLYIFRAPIVGTFYNAPKPDAEPFLHLGDSVESGSVLCIIEAMKIFNQIESDAAGEIIRVRVENGQPVEYGEPLFEIRLRS